MTVTATQKTATTVAAIATTHSDHNLSALIEARLQATRRVEDAAARCLAHTMEQAGWSEIQVDCTNDTSLLAVYDQAGKLIDLDEDDLDALRDELWDIVGNCATRVFRFNPKTGENHVQLARLRTYVNPSR